MTIKVREIKQKNNLVGVQLDIHRDGKRTQKMLKIRYPENPRNVLERQEKKEKKELVRKIVAKMELDEHYSDVLLDRGYKTNSDFYEFCLDFIERKAPNCEMKTYKSVVLKLKEFSKKKKLICSEIDEEFLISFKDFLNTTLNGSTPYNYFKKLKRMIKEASIAKYFKENPSANIVNSKGVSTEKNTLTSSEVKLLQKTHCAHDEIKRAFLFCCLTGLRFCDVEALLWKNISEGIMNITQIKTKEKLAMKLHQDAIKLIGKAKNDNEKVFNLPCDTYCRRILKDWVEKAGIDKHITWHCARHTFATSLVFQKENILTVSKLLGHKNIRETETYVRVAQVSMSDAVNKIPSIYL